MNLLETRHVAETLSMLERARQELLMVGDDQIADMSDDVENLYERIAARFTEITGIPAIRKAEGCAK